MCGDVTRKRRQTRGVDGDQKLQLSLQLRIDAVLNHVFLIVDFTLVSDTVLPRLHLSTITYEITDDATILHYS